MTRLGELDPEVLPPHYRHNSASAWIFFKADQPGFNFGVKFSYGEELRVVRYIDDGDKASTRRLFEGLHTKKKEIEQRIGAHLKCRIEKTSVSTIYTSKGAFALESVPDRREAVDWATKMLRDFVYAFRPHIRYITETAGNL